MKLLKKILLTISSWILFMLILPIVFTNALSATSAMGAYILLFFVVYPLLSLVLGMLAGTVHKALWWIPLGTAVLFPLLFSVSIGELVFD